MIICASCGQANEDGADFCANPECKAYLQWAERASEDERAARTERTVDDERALAMRTPVSLAPAQAPPEEKRQGVLVTLAREPVVVEAGEEATLGVRVRNTGTIVEEFVLEVTGAPAGWTKVEPASLSLFPGADQSAVVTFRPPRAPDTPAGELPFRVKAASKVDPSVSGSDSGVVTVKGFRLLSVELTPQGTSGRWMTTHRLSVTNQGNLPLSATVRASDPTEDLRFKVTPEELELGANSQGGAKVRVCPRRWRWTGSPAHRPFQVVTQPEGGAPLSADGARVQVPILPRWVLRLVAAICAAALAIGGVALVRSLTRKPDVVIQTPAATASPSGPALGAGPAPEGGAAPGGGPAPEGGQTPGPPPPPTPGPAPSAAAPAKVQVPNVAGQGGPAAVQALQAAGLRPELQRPEVNNAVARDSVIRSEPAGGTEVDKDSAVKLFVSAGPTPPFDLLGAAPSAAWSSGAGPLPFNGSDADNRGFVLVRQGVKIEDGSMPPRVLQTHPQWVNNGFIQGDYQLPAPIIAGDHFTAQVGFLSAGIAGEVDFKVIVTDAQGRATVAGNVHDKADGRLQPLEFDLSRFAGARTISLRVETAGPSNQDWAVWVDPKIAGRAGG